MTNKARTLARRLANGGTYTVRITKRDGSERQMRFTIAAHPAIRFSSVDGSAMIRVDDLDRHDARWLRLDAVHQLTESRGQTQPRMAEARARMDLIFA